MAHHFSHEPSALDRPLPGARRAVALLLAINLFNYMDRFILAAVLPRIGETIVSGETLSDTNKGWLATAFLMAYMLCSPVFGYLADRMNRWLLVGAGVILWSLASGASGLAHTYAALLITRMFVGIGEAAYGPAAPTIISDMYPVARRGQVLSWFYLAIPVGSALGFAFGGLFSSVPNTDHWRWAFYLVVPPGILLGLFCLFMPIPPRGASDAIRTARKASMRDYRLLLRTPSYVYNCLGMAALTFAIGGMSYWIPSYIYVFRMQKQGDLQQINLIFGAITVITGITATLAGGYAGDWLRNKVRGAYFVVSAAGLFAAFPFFLCMLFVPFPWAWAFIFLAEFCLFFNTGPSNTALANVTHPAIRSTAFAVNIFFIHALGDAISPPIIGALTRHTGGNMNVGFAAVGLMILAGGVFWAIGTRHLDRDTAAAPHQLPAA